MLKITHCAPLKSPIYVLRIISVVMGHFKTIMQWAILTLDGPFLVVYQCMVCVDTSAWCM